MKEISKAIINVMQAVKGMEKNSKVGAGKASYDGTKYSDVAERFNEEMAKNGLSMLPIGVEEDTQLDRWEEVDPWSKETPKATKQKQSVFTKVKTKYLLLHTSGESIELAGYGHGVDAQDKGAGKALTYAYKNTLLYTFLTPVGKMDDTELTHSDDINTPSNKPTITIQSAIEEMKKCDTLGRVKNCWSKHKNFQNVKSFIETKEEMKTKLS